MKNNKKILNLRLFFVGFIGIIFGIFSFYQLLNIIWLNKVTAWFVFFCIFFASAIACCFYLAFNKSYRKFLKYIIMYLILFVIGFSIFAIKINTISNYATFDGDVEVVGSVDAHYKKNGYYYITLNKVKVNGNKLQAKMRVYVTITSSIPENLSLGDEIRFVGDVSLQSLYTDKIHLDTFVDNEVYSSNTTSSELQIIDKDPGLIYFLQQKLRNTLQNSLTQENADIAYGVLVGDKDALNQDVKDTFSFAGISHVLAVSGLHVGFLVALLTLLLNICRVGRRNRFLIISVILIFYCVFCNMSASILRATIMTVILLLSGVLGEEYDGLNSLGVAGIVILSMFPLHLFSLGFQLSFMCVFMIITLADKLTRVLTKWGVPNWLASAISISFCVTIGTAIICANTMSQVSLVSIIANLIVIPIFGLTFPLLFVSSIFSMIIPIGNVLLFVPQLLLHAVKLIANFFASTNLGNFRIFNLGYLILLTFVLFSFVVKFLMLEKPAKYIVNGALLACCVIMFFVGITPTRFSDFALYTNYQFETNSAIITTENNKKFLMGYDEYTTYNFVNELKILKLDGWILQDFEVNRIQEYIAFMEKVPVNKIIIPRKSTYVAKVFVQLSKFTDVIVVDEFYDDLGVKFIANDDDLIAGTILNINNKEVLFINGSLTKTKLEILNNGVAGVVDYVYSNSLKYSLEENGVNYENLILCNSPGVELRNLTLLNNVSYYKLNLGGES